MTELIAHRGANREAPENTLRAFELAIESGADGIELDIRLSRDGVPVVHHDAGLAPEAPGMEHVPIAALTARDASRRASVPSLEQVLEMVAQRCQIYVEIKEARALAVVVELLRGRESWCSVHCFDHRAAALAHKLAPGLATGVLIVGRLIDSAGALRQAHARDLWQHADFVDADLVREVHGDGKRVIAWTVNETDRCTRMLDLGVDGLCTDEPRALRAVVKPVRG